MCDVATPERPLYPPGTAVSPAILANGGGLRNSPHRLDDIQHGLQATTLPVEATTGLDSPHPKPRRWRASQGASKGLQGRNRHGAVVMADGRSRNPCLAGYY